MNMLTHRTLPLPPVAAGSTYVPQSTYPATNYAAGSYGTSAPVGPYLTAPVQSTFVGGVGGAVQSGYTTGYTGPVVNYTGAVPTGLVAAPQQTYVPTQPVAAPVSLTTTQQQPVPQTGRPKIHHESRYVLVPRTVQEQKVVKEKAIRYVDKQIWETKMVAIQVPKTIMVDQTIEVDKEILVPMQTKEDREIKIPFPVFEKKTIKVPKQRVVTEYEERTVVVPETEDDHLYQVSQQGSASFQTIQQPTANGAVSTPK